MKLLATVEIDTDALPPGLEIADAVAQALVASSKLTHGGRPLMVDLIAHKGREADPVEVLTTPAAQEGQFKIGRFAELSR